MSMPYHKELLRSSVSLCFREFFVFRNKAKGVMTLLCQFEKMIYPSGTGAADAASFMIALYRPCEKLKDSSGNTITQIKAVGYCLPTAGNMRYEMRGHWRKDPKYGIQYDVEGYEEQIIPTREGIIAYLSSGQIKGIGPKMAERIYDAFGNMALEVLDKKPEKLLTISGISQNKLKKICDSYLANRGARDVVAFLSPHGITPNRAVKLYKEYGEQTMDIVKNHPYKLCEMVGVGFKTADKIAMSMGIDRLSPERVDEGILYTLTDAEGYGNLCMERDGFIAACQKTLETPELTDQMIAARANRLILDGRMRTYESCVYREKTAKAEEKLADLIRYQIRHQNPCTYGDLDHELDREESRLKVRLAPEQRQAIKTALTSGLCIITGGPGTGKTMLQKALLGIYSRNHPSKEIVCCAPTGRAARRMEQSTGFPASTVHKALGLIAGEDGEYGDPETLDADLILVDEVSMLDIYLAGDLFDSVKPGSQLILIGDADQLPSVGPGAVLSEMIASGTVPVVKLDNFIGTTGGLELALRNLINGLYSRDLSVKVRSANKTRSRRGEYWGGSAFYGYRLDPKDKHHLLVDQETAPVVVRIFEECIAGRTAAQIARALNDDGIPSPASYKEKNGEFYNGRILEENPIWVACTVLRIIKDERYTGKMISNKRETVGISTGKMRALPRSEWIIVEDTHEAIISQSIFSEADASRRSRIKTVNQNTAGERADNLFVCGYCGRKLQKSKGKVTHLFCLKAGVSSNADCTRLHEPIETLQSSVLEVVKMLAKTLAEKAVQVKANANREEPLLEKKAAMLKRTLQRAQNSKLDLYEEYRNGRMTRDKFIAAQEERQTAIDSMRDELAATEAMITKLRAGKEKAAVLEADAKGIQLLNEYRPKELRKLIEKVRVYENGRIEIDFRCHDDFTEKIIKAVAQLAG